MAMSVSHEMRNPLTVAKGFLQMLGNEPVLSAEKKQQYINYALNELQRTDDIIHTYMNMVEADSNLLSAFNLRAELEHILAALEPFANIRHVKIYSKVEGDFWVYSEKKLLRKCLTYMIQLRLEMLPPGSILNLRLDGVQSYVRLTLSDRGENTARGQSGLRMMFVIGMLNSLNADIRIRKQKHKGTRISISVPLYRAQMLKENKNSKHSL